MHITHVLLPCTSEFEAERLSLVLESTHRNSHGIIIWQTWDDVLWNAESLFISICETNLGNFVVYLREGEGNVFDVVVVWTNWNL